MTQGYSYGARSWWLRRRARIAIARHYLWSSGLPVLAGLTLVCMFVLLARPPGLDAWREYRFLTWNLFLAWVPYFFAVAADLANRGLPRAWPLPVTPGRTLAGLSAERPVYPDRLRSPPARAEVSLHYDAVLIGAFAFTGCLIGAMSLRIMQSLVERRAGWRGGWAFVVTIVGLSGIGIYMGRVLRWNSWYIVTRPREIIDALADALREPLDHPRAIPLSITAGRVPARQLHPLLPGLNLAAATQPSSQRLTSNATPASVAWCCRCRGCCCCQHGHATAHDHGTRHTLRHPRPRLAVRWRYILRYADRVVIPNPLVGLAKQNTRPRG